MKELHPGSVDNRKDHSKNMQILTGQIPAVFTCEDLFFRVTLPVINRPWIKLFHEHEIKPFCHYLCKHLNKIAKRTDSV